VGLSLQILTLLQDDPVKGDVIHGTIRTQKKCPKCGRAFQAIISQAGKLLGYACPEDLTTPDRYYYDLHHQGERFPLFSNKRGQILDSFSRAQDLQKAVSQEIEDRSFDPSRYIRRRQEEFWISKAIQKYEDQNLAQIAPGNKKNYKRILRVAREYFGPTDFREIRAAHLLDYKIHLEKEFSYSAKTMKNYLDGLRAFMRHCCLVREDIDRVPRFPQIEVPDPGFKWLNIEDQGRLFSHCPAEDLPIVTFIRTQGIRAGEARAIKIRDVDLALQTILICSTWSGKELRTRRKGRHSRAYTIPIRGENLEHIKNRLADRLNLPEAFLFVNPRTGGPYSESALKRVADKIREDSGLSKDFRIFHDGGRHSVASQLVNEGVGIEHIAQILGHSTTKMTERYAHLQIETLRTDLEKLSAKKVVEFKKAKEE